MQMCVSDCWIFAGFCRLLIADASLLLLRVVVMCFHDCTNGNEMSGRMWVAMWSGYLHPCGLSIMPVCLLTDRLLERICHESMRCNATAYNLRYTRPHVTRTVVALELNNRDDAPMIRRRRQDGLRRRRRYGDTAHATHLDFLDSNRSDTSTHLSHYYRIAIILAWWLPCVCRTTAKLPDPGAQPSVKSRLRADDSILRSHEYGLESFNCLHGLDRC